MDLKVIIGVHSKIGDALPLMDSDLVQDALGIADETSIDVSRQMSNDDWYWWRTCEHIQEVHRPTAGIREWMKLCSTDDEEPRVIETCEMERTDFAGEKSPCDGGGVQLYLCQRVRRFLKHFR